jgi:diguanylate cyclase (GGDEF)-like protein
MGHTWRQVESNHPIESTHDLPPWVLTVWVSSCRGLCNLPRRLRSIRCSRMVRPIRYGYPAIALGLTDANRFAASYSPFYLIASMPANTIQRAKSWRNVILEMGHYRSVLAITLFSILMSVMLNGVLMKLFWREEIDVFLKASLVAVIIPGIVAPLASNFVVKLLFELEELQTQLLEMVNRDPLTKVHSRRYLLDCLEIESARTLRENEPMSLLILDVDYFKSINDRYGHGNGDHVLQEIAQVCESTLRPYDVMARFGGEEFVVLLPNTSLPEACNVAERIRENIAVTTIQITSGDSIRSTISIGISQFIPPDPNCKNLLSRADKGLYKAKNNGRNQWAIAD